MRQRRLSTAEWTWTNTSYLLILVYELKFISYVYGFHFAEFQAFHVLFIYLYVIFIQDTPSARYTVPLVVPAIIQYMIHTGYIFYIMIEIIILYKYTILVYNYRLGVISLLPAIQPGIQKCLILYLISNINPIYLVNI